MTNIPKKLELKYKDHKFLSDTSYEVPPTNKELMEKINELIDYLQAKEEASKGECHKLLALECSLCGCRWIRTPEELEAGLKEYCPICAPNHDKKINPPQHEESKVHHSKILPFDVKIPKGATGIKVYGAGEEFLGQEDYTPPPEHEEELVGAIARGWCHTSTSNKVMDTELAKAIGDEVRYHINKFYVSKEKIKREAGETIKRLVTYRDRTISDDESWTAGYKYAIEDCIYRVESLLESLGLGD